MKKIIAWIMLAAMMLGMFAGCGKAADPTQPSEIPEVPTEAVSGENNAADVIAYLDVIYKDSGAKTPGNFNRFGIVRIAGVPYEVVWTADVAEDLVKIVVNDDGTVTVDVNEECTQDTNYVLTATCTDDNGNTASTSWEYLLPGVDYEGMKAIVDQAYALDKGAVLDGEHTLMGEIISVDSAWSDQYKNITVSIAVKDREDKPIQCYRLKGDGAQDLMVGDTITVFGTLKNYNGTIEFDAGCQLVAVIKGDGVAIEAPTDPKEIMKEAYALRVGMSLPYNVTLTGVVTSVTTAYSTQYKNISVTMDVDGAPGYEILCYRLKGTDAETLNANDVITVTGKIKNYSGTIEFDAGCELVSVTQKAPPTMPNNQQCIVDSAYALAKNKALPYVAALTGKVVSIDTPFNKEKRNITITIVVDQREDKPIVCYKLSGTGAETLEEGDVVQVAGTIKHYYDSKTKTSTIEFDQGCRIMNVWKSFDYGPLNEGAEYLMFVSKTDGKLYFNGKMSGYYAATSSNKDEAVIVYADRTNQGVLFYFMDGEVKTYISAVASGKYVNIKLTDEATSYFTYNTEIGAYTTKVDGKELFMGSNGTYKTLSLYTVDKITDSNYQPVQFVTNDPPADTALSVADAIALGQSKAHNNYTEGKYYVTGEITEIYNTTYGNMKITDGAGNVLTVYGTWSADGKTRFDKLENPPAVGDTVTVYGIIGQYGGTSQIKNGWLRDESYAEPETPETPDVPVLTTPEEIVNAAYALEKDASLEGTYSLTGTITSIDTPYSEQYKNITVTIQVGDMADKPIVCFRLKGDGADTLAVGDVVTVTGTLMNYAGTVEFNSGCTFVKAATPAVPTTPEEIVNAAYALEKDASLEGTYSLTGTVTSINTPYSEQYKNITVTIQVGDMADKPIVCFRLKGDGADALAVGDVITVTGTLMNYAGTVEFNSGCTFVKASTENPDDSTESDTPAVDASSSLTDVLAAAQALENGASLDFKYTITGTIITAYEYNTTYNNITVIMEVADTTVQCYRLAGEGADQIAEGDTITVTGTLGKNDKGYIRFNQGCTLDSWTDNTTDSDDSTESDTPAVDASSSLTDVLAAAQALENGASLDFQYTITGTIITAYEYNTTYNNITVIMEVGDTTVQCYRLAGEGANQIAEGDTITVTGTLGKNDKGYIRFNQGCTLDTWTDNT